MNITIELQELLVKHDIQGRLDLELQAELEDLISTIRREVVEEFAHHLAGELIKAKALAPDIQKVFYDVFYEYIMNSLKDQFRDLTKKVEKGTNNE